MTDHPQNQTPRRTALSALSPPSLPSSSELQASFRPEPRAAFWYLKGLIKKTVVDDGDDGVEFRAALTVIANGYTGEYWRTKAAEVIYRVAIEEDCQPVVEKGELWVGRKMNVARSKASDLLSLSERRKQARIAHEVNDSGN